MSDYSPDPRRPDPRRTEVTGGRSTYAVVALLGIVALVGGVLMFTGPHQPSDQQAQAPATTMTAPLERPAPAPAPAPTAPATPQQ